LTVEPFLTARETPLGFSFFEREAGRRRRRLSLILIRAKSRSFGGGFGRFVFSGASLERVKIFDFGLIKETIR